MVPVTKLDFSKSSILVMGDVMLDRYWFGDSTRLSPEAPVPVVLVKNVMDAAGGAANVALNVANLGGQVQLLSVVGRDQDGDNLEALLEGQNVKCHFWRSEALHTSVKLRIISRNQQIVRADFEDLPENELMRPLVDIFRSTVDLNQVVIFSDYGKGGLSHIAQMIEVCRRNGQKVLVDPKGSDYSVYRGANVITPNRAEFAQVAGAWSSMSDFISRAFSLRDKLDLEALLVTRSEEGMSLFIGSRHVQIPAQAKEVFDVSGAGDTVIAVLGTALSAGYDLEHAAYLANAAASIVVGKVGTCPITLKELNEHL